MKAKRMYLKNLTPGVRFIYNDNGTVYTCESVRSGAGLTSVVYTVPGARNEFYGASLTMVEVVS